MAHWSGTRSGWNTRGGSPSQRLRNQIEYQKNHPALHPFWKELRADWNTFHSWDKTEHEKIFELRDQQIDDHNSQFWTIHAEFDNPDSFYWSIRYEMAIRSLADLIGNDDAELWMELTWPGDSIDQVPYKLMFEQITFAINNPEITSQELECSCNGVTPLCDVCKAHLRVKANNEMIAEIEA